jgi:putative restriction endonuclease
LRVALCGREIFDGIPAKAEMKLFVGVTNDDWFRFLAEKNPEEVNFWRPRSQNDFKALKSGDIFLFKLHSPFDFIAGGGVFLKHTFLPLQLAWEAFGLNNGVPDYESFERRILEHREPS